MSVYSKFDVIAPNRSGNLLIWGFLGGFSGSRFLVKPWGKKNTKYDFFKL